VSVRAAEYEVLSESECRDLLAQADVGRVAFVDGEFPVVMPVNYLLDDDVILIRSDAGAKNDRIPMNAVAFEVDAFERWNKSGWSVLVKGYGRDVTDAVARVTTVSARGPSTRGRRASDPGG
jgi:nitroimidazol reductase NimA-like FMN-containing flavoprotein (pyridoxamine 5'-phosphate oxidase superfamily)